MCSRGVLHVSFNNPSSSSSLYIWNQGVDRYLIYWLAWEVGSRSIGNWKIREWNWVVFQLIRLLLIFT